MSVAWPIPYAFKHFICILLFVIMLILNIDAYIRSDSVHNTYKVMVGLILFVVIMLCIVTGKTLKKYKIRY